MRRTWAVGLLVVVGCAVDDRFDDVPAGSAYLGDGAYGMGGGGTIAAGGSAPVATIEPQTVFSGVGSRIVGAENTVGIDGSFFIVEDIVVNGLEASDGLAHTDLYPNSGGVSTNPSSFDAATVKPCVSGEVAGVTAADGGICDPTGAGQACQWDAQWGGGIGVNLLEVGGVPSGWNAQAASVIGFNFRTSGAAGGLTMRFSVIDATGSTFCKEFAVGSSVNVDFAELQKDCDNPVEGSPNLMGLTQLRWELVPRVTQPVSVSSFCIETVGVH